MKLQAAISITFWTVQVVLGYQVPQVATTVGSSRRAFLTTTAAVAGALLVNPDEASAVDIKVTPLAHTFITASGSIKPIRENDATRFFTNARVVYLLGGAGDLAAEVVELTKERKAGQGPGVTPGSVQVLEKFSSIDQVVSAANSMPAGDVLLVGPIASKGTAGDGKLLADTASAMDTLVGGRRGRGVISVLLDGPKQGLLLEEGGYPASELLWYPLSRK